MIGKVVRNSHGYEGLVVDNAGKMDPWWVRGQEDTRAREFIDDDWYSVLCFSGGAINAHPELVEVLRDATAEDVQKVLDGGHLGDDWYLENCPILNEIRNKG